MRNALIMFYHARMLVQYYSILHEICNIVTANMIRQVALRKASLGEARELTNCIYYRFIKCKPNI